MTAFYNEVDPFAAQWLRNLIAAGHIAPGIVDERPIQEIEAWELVGFTQCHFFAGIGVWSHALRRAGWPDSRPIWTGSCPCQPFSNAGQKKGFSDERHLWPYWQKLIAERKPDIVAGEQVASALEWIDLVSADMEKSNYAFGAVDLCAAGFDGAHIRQRNYFVGISNAMPAGRPERRTLARDGSTSGSSSSLRLVDDDDDARPQGWSESERKCSVEFPARPRSMVGGLADKPRNGHGPLDVESERGRRECSIGPNGREISARESPTDAPMLGRMPVDWLFCRDGKWRPVEPGTFPLVDAAPARVGRLRAYGNALDAETTTQFCAVVKEICDGV